MARTHPNLALYIFTISIFISFIIVLASDEGYNFVKAIDRKKFLSKKQKLSHLRLYWHDVLSGRHPTSVPVIMPPFNSSTGFGTMNMMDNALTIGLDLSSKIVGRAQGFYASASQEELGFLMVMNFAITDGKYNGSTITVVGRNAVFNQVREMPVIGGSGLFRFARGYAEARTRKIDFNTGDATVEYNIYVMHY